MVTAATKPTILIKTRRFLEGHRVADTVVLDRPQLFRRYLAVLALGPGSLVASIWASFNHPSPGSNAMRKERLGLAPISLAIVTASEFDRPEDDRRLHHSLSLIGVTGKSARPVGSRLEGEELRAFNRTPWWYGGDPREGTEYWSFRNRQGEVVGGGPWWGSGTGRFLGIENAQICNEVPDGTKICSAVYRNLEGTRENNDEYIVRPLYGPSYGSVWSFSAYEERPPALKDLSFND